MAAVDEEELWSQGVDVVRRLRGAGFEAYLVGGCVRDRLLGRAVHDIDIATSALPEDVMATFVRTLPTGLQHGTVTVMENGVPFEVTTYRHEKGYSDGRRPDEVTFVRNVKEDLARRDFTMNAIAAGPDGETIDPFGGESDLRSSLIRCVGDAESRFGEDALRMLRAVRFAAALDFRLALSTWRGIKRQRSRLKHVAMERVAAEWDKLMASGNPDQGMAILIRSGLLAHVKDPLPKAVAALAFGDERWRRIKDCRLSEADDADVRWAAFMTAADCREDEAVELCRKLRLSAARTKRISCAVGLDRLWAVTLESGGTNGAATAFGDPPAAFLSENKEPSGSLKAIWVKLVLRLGKAAAYDWLHMAKCRPKAFRLLAYAERWTNELSIWKPTELAVRGDELSRAIDKAPGPWIAELLDVLLALVALGQIDNEPEALLDAARLHLDGGKPS